MAKGSDYYFRPRKELYTGSTVAGRFVFPKLTRPDKKFKKEHGEYQVSLDLEGQEAADLAKLIEENFESEYNICRQSKRKTKLKKFDFPFSAALDKDKEEIPGVTRFRFKKRGGGIDSSTGEAYVTKLPIFGAAGETKKITEPIWGGTVGRINFTISPWFTDALGFGVTLELNAVQILSLVTAGEREASDYGFGDESGDYEDDAPSVDENSEDGDDSSETGLGDEEGGVEF